MTLTPGMVLQNRYRIVQLLGQGGFGAVYRAWDLTMDSPVAVKESLQTSPEAQTQFQTEARLLFKLRHPNLPRVFDHFAVAEQGVYLVMDFIEGEDLASMLNRQPGQALPVDKVLAWLGQVCDALIYLHSQNPPVIHRDIKPANIRITPQNQAMLVDFGIAKLFDPNLRTATAARAVTPGYSPLEQYGMGATDTRSDVYALGATAYHLLSGTLPPEAVQLSISAEALLPAMRRNPSLPPQVSMAIQHAMQINLAQRPSSMAAFKAELFGWDAASERIVVTSATRSGGQPPGDMAAYSQAGMAASASKPPASAPSTAGGFQAAPDRSLYTPSGTQVVPPGAQGAPQRAPSAPYSAPGAPYSAPLNAPAAAPRRLTGRWVIGLGVGGLFLALCLGAAVVAGLQIIKRSATPTPTSLAAVATTLPASPTALPGMTPTGLPPTEILPTAVVISPLTERFSAPPRPTVALSPENAVQASQLALWGAGDIFDAAWSPDGSALVVSSTRGFYLYDPQSFQFKRWIETEEAPYKLYFLEAGQVLAAETGDGRVRRWRASDGNPISSVYSPEGTYSMAIAPSGEMAASVINNKTITLWRISDGQELRTLEGHPQGLDLVVFSADGSLLASGGNSEDKSVRVWRVADGQLLHTLQGHTDGISALGFSADGSWLATGDYSGLALIWNVQGGALQHRLEGHTNAVYSVAFDANGRTLATTSYDHTARLWAVSDGSLLHNLAESNYGLFSAAFSLDGSRLATAGYDATVYIWDTASGGLVEKLEHTAPFRCITISPDGKLLAACSQNYDAYVWRLSDAALLTTFTGHSNMVSGLAFSPDGERLLSSSYDSTARLWQVSGGQELLSLKSSGGSVRGVAFAPDGQSAATAGYGELRLWSLADGSMTWEQNNEDEQYYCVALSPDGQSLATGEFSAGRVSLWDAATGKRRVEMKDHTSVVFAVAFSPDGKTLASASGDHTVRLWSAADGRMLKTLAGHDVSVYSVAFSSDGRLLAGGAYREILLWDLASGDLLARLKGHRAAARLAFTPDNLYLISAGIDGTIRFWGIAP